MVAVQRTGTQFADVTYDVVDADGDTMAVRLDLSPDGGGSFPVPCVTVSGDVGAGILSGTGRQIVWDAGVDYPGHVGVYWARMETAAGRVVGKVVLAR